MPSARSCAVPRRRDPRRLPRAEQVQRADARACGGRVPTEIANVEDALDGNERRGREHRAHELRVQRGNDI
ncbi:hypothetical protein A0H81_10840 [Grifola frondosa]|uniref:Uncharacterized protein n=1 Tax=Grifola frondosa TaxID=5627 RepID=A0A1C7LXB9_GRIFR|nr:hypothetical protein A0H81_10840 [Grifola frondosa]